MTTVVLLGHGSRDPRAAAAMRVLAAELETELAGPDVTVAFLDHNQPTLQEAIDALPPDTPAVIVLPMLLSRAFHATADVPREVAALRTSLPVQTLDPIGPDAQLLQAVAADLSGSLVLAFSGTSDAEARRELERAALTLARERGLPVRVGYVTQAAPDVPAAIAAVEAGGVVTFTLFPGMFTDRIRKAATLAGLPSTAPLCEHPAFIALLSERIRAAAGA